MKEENKIGQEPAFPCEVSYENGQIHQQHQNGNTTVLDNGMSKRFYAACAAMQGILSSGVINPNSFIKPNYKVIVEDSYKLADELLKQENNE